MKNKLKNICKITSGIFAKPFSKGEILYIQGRDIDSFQNLKEDIAPVLLWEKQIERHYLKEGDVLVAAKGINNFASTYYHQAKPAVASSTFLVIRDIDREKILPEYLRWFINHPITQEKLQLQSKGTNLPSINKEILGNIDIEIPALRKQELIIRINDLKQKEKRIRERIENLKTRLISHLLFKAISNE